MNIILKSDFKFPEVDQCHSASDFFLKFTQANNHRRSFSQRSVCQKLKWSMSYMSDVIHGRKKFTVIKAIQFSFFFNLNFETFNGLIFLAILDSQNLSEETAKYLIELRRIKITK